MTPRRAAVPALRALLLALAAVVIAAPAHASLPTLGDLARAGDELNARPSALGADLPRELPGDLPKECNGPFCLAPLETRVGGFDLRLSCRVGGEAGLTCGSRRAYGLGYGGRAVERSVFTGHIFDTETQLYQAGARFYDPAFGRFITQDDFKGRIDNPPSLNLYLYAYANPGRYFDPDGHDPLAFAQAVAHGRGWDYAKGQLKQAAAEAGQATKKLLDKAGMAVSLAAAESLSMTIDPETGEISIFSPGHNPTREYLAQQPHAEDRTERLMADVAGIGLDVAPLVVMARPGGARTRNVSEAQKTAVLKESTAAADPPATQPAVPPAGPPATDAVVERAVTPSQYARLRAKTPSSIAREYVNPPGPKKDPVYGYPVDRLEADHAYPMNKIVDEPGFAALSEEEQLSVLNNLDNMQGLGKRTNASMQDKSVDEWPGHKELGPPSAEARDALSTAEQRGREAVRRDIQERLKKQEEQPQQ